MLSIRVYLALLIPLVAGAPHADAQSIAARDVEYFEKHVRPLLAMRCHECHSAESEDVGGNLMLDSKNGWERGGDLGPAVVAGDPDGSLLIRAVRYLGDDLRMPPDGRLSDQEITILENWIRAGATDPRTTPHALPTREIDIESGRQFWAFQPLNPATRQPHFVDSRGWARNQVDQFIWRQLRQRGLEPNPPAGKRVLLRRVTFDLIGLPPSPAEVAAFMNDDSPDAYRKVVDRLLASHHYGQRWGRFWLDVARYADSNGLDENIAHGNAWRYRDYVISAFNADKPYDDFVTEQLAGDLLPRTDCERTNHERTIATGFLSIGPKVLAEVDETKMELDIIDEQLDTVGRAFMGLTLGCARCHDHKFDPFRTEDYYALAGIFKSTRTMEHFKKIARWHEVSIATELQKQQRRVQEELALKLTQDIERLTQAATGILKEGLSEGQAFPEDAEAMFSAATRAELERLRGELKQLKTGFIELPTAMGVADYSDSRDLRVHIRGSHLTKGAVVPRGFPAVLVMGEEDLCSLQNGDSGRLQLARWLVDPRHPLVSRVIVNRIWRWHFGRGLVASTDNFGRLGDRPTHPGLLDWLAAQFIRAGWSVKSIHRRIVLSSTYRMSSGFDSANAETDPANVFRWRANVRRLDAAAIRDSLLFVGGQLDTATGGSLLHVKNREFLFDHTSRDETDYSSHRRSVYLPVIRNHLYDVFELFDYGDASVSSSDRSVTTVAPQALFMMNSDFAIAAADAMAARVLAAGCDTPRQSLELAYRIACGRRPTGPEVARDLRYLRQFHEHATRSQLARRAPSHAAWRLLCHALIASNEFIHIR